MSAGLDLNASFARAVAGGPDAAPAPLPLEETGAGLPLALSLQGRHPEVGLAGTVLCREFPHLVCQDFLPHLGTEKCWAAGRHRLDAARALGLVFDSVRLALGGVRSLVLALPPYLSSAQAVQAVRLAQRAKLPVAGSIAAPLALGWTAHARQPWSGAAVLVDVDHYALTGAVLRAAPGQLQVLSRKTLPILGLRIWKERLLNAIADLCIHHNRRDPRDSGSAEQLLHDQLDGVLEACDEGQMVELVIRTSTWCQNLILQPRQILSFCAPLIREAAEEVSAAWQALSEGPTLVILSAAAARLPGLAPALVEAAGGKVPTLVLGADAAAQAAFTLACSPVRGMSAAEHLGRALSLPPADSSAPENSNRPKALGTPPTTNR